MSDHETERDDAIRTLGEGIAEIGMRTIEQDRDLDSSELAAVGWLARSILSWVSGEPLSLAQHMTMTSDTGIVHCGCGWTDLNLDEGVAERWAEHVARAALGDGR